MVANLPARLAVVTFSIAAIVAVPRLAAAQASPAPAMSPAPAASPTAAAGPADPCAALSSLVSRPTFGTSACAVKPHDLLIESGYTNLTASGNGAGRSVTYPQASLRVGVAPNLEFDLDPGSVTRLSGPPEFTGISDTSLGIKYEFGYTSRLLFGANVLYTANTGDPAVSGNGDGVLANLNGALTLSPAVGLFATLGYNAQSAGSTAAPLRYRGIDPSLGGSVSLPAALTFALEGFGQSSTGPGLGGRYGADAALERDVGSRLQLDVNYFQYFGAQSGTHLHAIGFGAAYLIGS
jgi:hypothetical protein